MPNPIAIPIAFAAAKVASDIWSGYQADKSNDNALKFSKDQWKYEKDQWKYEKDRQALADRTNAANAATSVSQGNTANAMTALDWLRNQYQVGGG